MAENTISRQNNPTQWAEKMAFYTFDIDDAVRCLDGDFPIRRIAEELNKVIKDKAEVRNTTYDEIKAVLQDACSAVNVDNWLTGKVKSLSRDSVIKIAFALQMSYEETEAFLKKCWIDGFYLRDVRDVIYRHGLENGWTYEAVAEMAEGFSKLNITNTDPDDSKIPQGEITKYLSEQASSARTREELEGIIDQNKQFFGTFRRRTYKRFMELYEQLKQEWVNIAELDNMLDSSRNQSQEYHISRCLSNCFEVGKIIFSSP